MERASFIDKAIAVAAGLVLALSIALAPSVPAFASQFESGKASDGGVVTAQSSKKSVYVRTQRGTDLSDEHLRRDFTYNSNGLISKIEFYSALYGGDAGVNYQKVVCSYKYNNKGLLTKITRKDYPLEGYTTEADYTTYTYKYNSINKPKTCTINRNGNKTVTKYKYNKAGTLTLVDNVDTSHVYGKTPAHRYTYPKYNKKGQLVSDSTDIMYYKNKKWVKDDSIPTSVYTWSYDSRGNVTKSVDKTYKQTTKYKNTYKNGLLAKMKTGGETYNYKYKKISVTNKFYKLVKQQQNDLINPTEYYL